MQQSPRRKQARMSSLLALLLLGWFAVPSSASAQMSGQDRDRARKILEQVRKNLHEHYYDSTFGGRDIDAAARHTDSLIQAAPSMPHALGAIAQYLADLKDSHTKFWPPGLRDEIEYGYRTLVVGDSVFIRSVKKGSDAEAKGLKRGDLLLAIDQMRTTRASLDIINYVYDYLSPRRALVLTVRSPGDTQLRKLQINAKVTPGVRVVDYTDLSVQSRILAEWENEERRPTQFYRSLGDSILIWRMPSFVHEDYPAIDAMIDRAKTHRALVFDLRDNGGGSVATTMYLISKFFDREIDVLTTVLRKERKPMKAKGVKEPYRGMFVILVNSNSGSAGEVFPRVMQIEGRAIVVGDRTAGAVITSIGLGHVVGFERVLQYGMSVSVADVIMSDGQRLENVGVIPDHLVLPTAEDLASNRDPQMAKALELVGVQVTPEQAYQLARVGVKDR